MYSKTFEDLLFFLLGFFVCGSSSISSVSKFCSFSNSGSFSLSLSSNTTFYIFLVCYYYKSIFEVLRILVVVFDFAAEIAVLFFLCMLLGLYFLEQLYQNFAWQLLVFFLLQKVAFLYVLKILYIVLGFFQGHLIKN